jgi:hypothetical protein
LCPCYCSDATCSAGTNGQCVSQINAVAGTTDEATILGELNDCAGVLSQVRTEAMNYAFSSCGPPCGDAIGI